jgi:hypothetical protein
MELYNRAVRSSNPTRPHVARRPSLASLGRIVANATVAASVLSFAVGRAPKPRAPKGGVEVSGRFYKGGQLLPASAAVHGETAPAVVHGEAVPNPRDAWPEWADADRWTIGEPDAGPAGVICHAEPPSYQPSARDEAWDAGWRFGRSGGSIYDGPGDPEGWPSDRDCQIAFCSGVRAGRQARQVAWWRETARSLALAGYRDCEPPTHLTADEAAAYRAGYASGVAEFEEERAYEAWVDSCEREAMERECRITDRDVYPAGCMS